MTTKNIKTEYIIKEHVTEDLIKETDKFWENPQNIINLIDLLFLGRDKEQVCS